MKMSEVKEESVMEFEKLQEIMKDIYEKTAEAAQRYGVPGNFVAGANIAGFEKVAEAMTAQGVV